MAVLKITDEINISIMQKAVPIFSQSGSQIAVLIGLNEGGNMQILNNDKLSDRDVLDILTQARNTLEMKLNGSSIILLNPITA